MVISPFVAVFPHLPSHPRSLPSQVRSRHLCGALRVRMRAGLAALSPHQSDGLRYLAVLRRGADGEGIGWDGEFSVVEIWGYN